MIEVELKARVGDVVRLLDALERLGGGGRDEVYVDTYYDDADRALARGDRELRIRTVRRGADAPVSVLTYKGARVEVVSGSKPEHETRVEDAAGADAVLRGLGYVPVIRFEKRCRNYAFERGGRRLLASLVEVPELGETFVEVETPEADDAQVAAALEVVRTVLADLGVSRAALTNETYTDAVAARRARAGAEPERGTGSGAGAGPGIETGPEDEPGAEGGSRVDG
ncbi:class IV adenylate cyclase [Embleya scabrispora]|uniref:class IV adenylate cyclase n=1 Tax=Embleya scabrispora TaxID=159449 RepID=UPI0007C43534|nr:class IV adenylate cyclase [Embleya scabrispora]MYS87468.1 class IV adenylate cyclase [Streptomyces sp. SID5474]